MTLNFNQTSMTTKTENDFRTQLMQLPDTHLPTLYEGESWGARICLTQEGRIYTAVFRKNDGTFADIWHGLTRTWEVPSSIKASALKSLLLKPSTLALLTRVSEGLSWDYDQRTNRVGVLTDDAAEAEAALERIFSAMAHGRDCFAVWTCREWVDSTSIADLWPEEESLEAAAAAALETASDHDVWLDDGIRPANSS